MSAIQPFSGTFPFLNFYFRNMRVFSVVKLFVVVKDVCI